MTFSNTDRFKRHPQAICSELDGEIALFQSNTSEYLVLNESGTAIWNSLGNAPTINQICEELTKEYEIDRPSCIKDVTAWLEEALQKKVVSQIKGDQIRR